MLKDLEQAGNQRPVTFFYGARTDRDLLLLEELGQLAERHPWFRFIPPSPSRPGTSGIGTGRPG